MRLSTLLLSSSLVLHGSDTYVAEATAGNDPNQAPTFLQMKNDIRPQRILRRDETTAGDERMFPSNLGGKSGIQKLGKLSNDGMTSDPLKKYMEEFNRLKLDTGHEGFNDGRIKQLDDYIKSHEGTDRILFLTLEKGFGSYANLARFIGLAKEKGVNAQYIEDLENRFVNYFVKRKAVSTSLFKMLDLARYGDKMFGRHEFKIMEKFLSLKYGNEGPQNMLNLLIGELGEGRLAVVLSKAVREPGFERVDEKYKNLLLQHMKAKAP